jgi:hypothetical protein
MAGMRILWIRRNNMKKDRKHLGKYDWSGDCDPNGNNSFPHSDTFSVPTEPITLDHICEWCGKQYRAERKAQRFCSLHCTMKCRCSKRMAV